MTKMIVTKYNRGLETENLLIKFGAHFDASNKV